MGYNKNFPPVWRKTMAGRLKKIVDFVREHSLFPGLTLARLSLAVGRNVEEIDEDTPDDPELEKKMVEAVKEILKVDDVPL